MSPGIENPYLGYTIYRFNPSTEAHVTTLQDLDEERNDGVIFLTKSYLSEVGKPTDILVKPSLKDEFVQKLTARGLPPQVIGNVSCDRKCCSDD